MDVRFLSQRDLDSFLNRGFLTLGDKRDLRAAVQERGKMTSEMLFMVSSLSVFVSISWKWQVKRLK